MKCSIISCLKKTAIMSGVLLLVACNGTIHKKSVLGQKNILSIDARQRLIVEGHDPVTKHKLYCAEPSPDAIVAQAASLASALDTQLPTVPQPNAPTNSIKTSLATNVSEAASSIGVRTQTIQLMRDGYYRLCEAMLNGQIGPEEYGSIVANIDGFILSMMAIEQLGGKIPIADNVAVIPGSSASTNVNGEAAAGAKAGTVTTGGVTVIKNVTEDGKVAQVQAQAIVDVMRIYFGAKHKTYSQRLGNDAVRRYDHPYYYRSPGYSADPQAKVVTLTGS